MTKRGVNDKTYRLSWGVTCAFSLDVKAKNKDEAKAKAKEIIERTHQDSVFAEDDDAVLDDVFLDPEVCVKRVY